MNSVAAARSRTRKFIVQALYQAQLTSERPCDVIHPFIEEHNMKRADLDYFREVLLGIDEKNESLNALIAGKLDREMSEIDPIEKAILWLGCYELEARVEVPYRVVINEGIELARSFGATDSFKYINSILDALARDLRQAETSK